MRAPAVDTLSVKVITALTIVIAQVSRELQKVSTRQLITERNLFRCSTDARHLAPRQTNDRTCVTLEYKRKLSGFNARWREGADGSEYLTTKIESSLRVFSLLDKSSLSLSPTSVHTILPEVETARESPRPFSLFLP